MKHVKKLAEFFDQELKRNLKNIMITYTNKEYMLFGRYNVINNDDLYKVIDIKTKKELSFSNLKYAFTYCTLLNAGKYSESNRVETLDLKLSSIQTDMTIHKKMYKNADNDQFKSIYAIKLQEDSYRRKLTLEEIKLYINSSKQILSSNFEHNYSYL